MQQNVHVRECLPDLVVYYFDQVVGLVDCAGDGVSAGSGGAGGGLGGHEALGGEGDLKEAGGVDDTVDGLDREFVGRVGARNDRGDGGGGREGLEGGSYQVETFRVGDVDGIDELEGAGVSGDVEGVGDRLN